MADLNLDQTRLFHVVGLTAKGKIVPLTNADVAWSVDVGTMSPTQADGSSTFEPSAVGTATVVVAGIESSPTPGVLSAPPVATQVVVEAAPVVSFSVTSDAAV